MTVTVTIKVPKELDKKVVAILEDSDIHRNAKSMFEPWMESHTLSEGETTLTIWGTKTILIKETP